MSIPPHTDTSPRSLQVYFRCNRSTTATLTTPPSLPPVAAPASPSTSSTNDLPIALRKGKRSCTAHPLAHSLSFKHLSPNYRAFAVSLSSVSIPNTYCEALKHPKWKMAMDEEMSALISRGTWELVEVPPNTDILACRWVFTLKFRAGGIFERESKLADVLDGHKMLSYMGPRETYGSTSSLKTWEGQGIFWELKSLKANMLSLYLRENMLLISFKKLAVGGAKVQTEGARRRAGWVALTTERGDDARAMRCGGAGNALG
ncbi:UNVERIFIED_CONTAM: hypothetical protein Slati_2901500 [Sesamum latifolium]|uniref:Mitochondrial protein n=1 Tax=Sesamum latifolium TaxID=2727402 RepID=A0AAW2VDJ2_9LAMI